MANIQYYDVLLRPVLTEKSMADMAVNGVNSSTGVSAASASYESVKFSAEITKTETTVVAASKSDGGAAAVYEKSGEDDKLAAAVGRKVRCP